MANDVHSVEQIDGSNFNYLDRVRTGILSNVPNVAGTSAGATVTTTVTFAGGLPNNYTAFIQPSQICDAAVVNKTNTGFQVVMAPPSVSVTIAAGTFDVSVFC